MDKRKLVQKLAVYESQYSEERSFIPRFISLLTNFHNCFSRSLITGHMTASAFIIDPERKYALLTHHKKLNRWLQPGGHADGNEEILDVAWKEAREETGLASLSLFTEDIFDIDIHQIPASNGAMAHFHYDIRFLFTAEPKETLRVSDESHDLAWIGISRINDFVKGNLSIERMCTKVTNQDLN